jgi:hypothetical protein
MCYSIITYVKKLCKHGLHKSWKTLVCYVCLEKNIENKTLYQKKSWKTLKNWLTDGLENPWNFNSVVQKIMKLLKIERNSFLINYKQ